MGLAAKLKRLLWALFCAPLYVTERQAYHVLNVLISMNQRGTKPPFDRRLYKKITGLPKTLPSSHSQLRS